MSKLARRRRHLALVRWCNGLPPSPAKPPLGYYQSTMWTAGRCVALEIANLRVWNDIAHRGPHVWIWSPNR